MNIKKKKKKHFIIRPWRFTVFIILLQEAQGKFNRKLRKKKQTFYPNKRILKYNRYRLVL